MTLVGGREFRADELRDIFRTLDGGGDRPAVRVRIRALQGRGVGNETIRDIRALHRAVRRSQGYNVKVGGVRNLLTADGQFKRLKTLPRAKRISQIRRPKPPKIDGVRVRVTARYELAVNGRPSGRSVVGVFDVSEGEDSLPDQIADARNMDIGSFSGFRSYPGGRRYEILQVRVPL